MSDKAVKLSEYKQGVILVNSPCGATLKKGQLVLVRKVSSGYELYGRPWWVLRSQIKLLGQDPKLRRVNKRGTRG